MLWHASPFSLQTSAATVRKDSAVFCLGMTCPGLATSRHAAPGARSCHSCLLRTAGAPACGTSPLCPHERARQQRGRWARPGKQLLKLGCTGPLQSDACEEAQCGQAGERWLPCSQVQAVASSWRHWGTPLVTTWPEHAQQVHAGHSLSSLVARCCRTPSVLGCLMSTVHVL